MKISEMISLLDDLAPFRLAEPWDKSGLRIGDPQCKVTAVAMTLDPVLSTVKEALRFGCNLLISHHPLIFTPISDMVLNDLTKRTTAEALKGNLAVISCHTCWDSAPHGLNRVLAQALGLQNSVPLLPSPLMEGAGMGSCGMLLGSMSLSDVGDYIAKCWNLTGYRLFGDEKNIAKVGLCGGAGGDLWPAAKLLGADLLVTADVKYYQTMEILDAGMALMVCDHGEMERFSMAPFAVEVEKRSGLNVHLITESYRSQWKNC